MNRGTFLGRLLRGTRWTWTAEGHRAALPVDFAETVMGMPVLDRHHAKQGRSTGRVRFDAPGGPLTVYLKRHDRLPWASRLAALFAPGLGAHTPAKAEWSHLEAARALGVSVPEVVAVGETIGPWGGLRSFLMVAELTGSEALNEALPGLKAAMSAAEFAAWKRGIIPEMAEIAAKLHRAGAFHKDLYLCHFYIKLDALRSPGRRLALIDLHRLGRHRLTALRWRWKDLGQLLFSTDEVEGIDDRDRLRFWKHYRSRVGPAFPRWQAGRIAAKADRYRSHNARMR